MRSSILPYTGVFLAATTAVSAALPACLDFFEVSFLYSAAGSDAASFCAAWSASNRATSPFPYMTATQVTTACACLAGPYGTCSPKDLAISRLTATYQDPQKICSWFTTTAASVSILSGLTANQALTACNCINQNPALASPQSAPLVATSSRSISQSLTSSRSTTTSPTTTSTTTTTISRPQGSSSQPGTSSLLRTTTSTSPPSPISTYGSDFYIQVPSATSGTGVAYNGGYIQFARLNSPSISTAKVALSLNTDKSSAVTWPFRLRSDGTLISNPGVLNASLSDVVSLNAKTLVSARADILVSDSAAAPALTWKVNGDVYGAPWITVTSVSREDLFIYICPQTTGGPLIYVGYAMVKSGCNAYSRMDVSYKGSKR
ncbi:hypothetical protein BDZ85DRAFT_254476 [Elsinoe ampelina]|uniref:Uncharacterized protein n=1 Tax=Elsinoe ampelina TaxID=302913 RepID=A0A6A6GPN8_9PEZI|nr:hypothetical protein BDZ85DRAFT_254476 [Elsinoe ampelina]